MHYSISIGNIKTQKDFPSFPLNSEKVFIIVYFLVYKEGVQEVFEQCFQARGVILGAGLYRARSWTP